MTHPTTHLNGKFQVATFAREMRMSHWINAPQILDLGTGLVRLDLREGLWDLMKVTESENSITLHMRKYPGSSEPIRITLTADSSTIQFNSRWLKNDELLELLDEYE